jgi:hypothetical protein
MTIHQIIDRYKKMFNYSEEKANNELKKNILNYAKDKCVTILMLDGRKHCDAGYLIKQYKRIFK